jgi:integrase/recombinase XerC
MNEITLFDSSIEAVIVTEFESYGPLVPPTAPDYQPPPAVEVVRLWLQSRRSPRTRRSYLAHSRHFCAFLSDGQADRLLASIEEFLPQKPEAVSYTLERYKVAMLTSGDKEASINARLGAVRSLLKFAYRLGASKTNGAGLVDSEKVQTYRDTRGYDLQTLQDFLDLPGSEFKHNQVRAKRDFALLLLLCELGLRRLEIEQLNVGDFSMRNKSLAILGKGKGTQKQYLETSPRLAGAIADYLLTAGHALDKGPLFRNLSRNSEHKGGRLTGEAIRLIVRNYGRMLGIDDVAPHKFRHSFATGLLDLTGGNLRDVKKATRHVDSKTLEIYDDNRKNVQGQLTNLMSEALKRKPAKKSKK